MRFAKSLLAGLLVLFAAPFASAGLIYNPVVLVVNSGGGPFTSSMGYTTHIYIYEQGVSNQLTPLSSTSYNSGGSGTRLVNSGSATSEGSLTNNPGVTNAAGVGTLYTGTQFVYNGGYDAATGTANVNSTATNANRSFGQTNVTDNTATSATVLKTQTQASAYNNNNFRGATGDDTGAVKYTAGTGSSSSTAGWRNFESNVQLGGTVTNVRTVELIGGNLYGSTSSGASRGIYKIDPIGPSHAVFINTGGSSNNYEFALFNDTSNANQIDGVNTAYITEDNNTTGGIQKWTFNGSTWTLAYTLKDSLLSTFNYRGLAGQFDVDTGLFTLFTTVESAGKSYLQQVTDGGVSSSFTTLAEMTTADGLVFRGVALSAAVPEPSSMVLAGLMIGGAGVGYVRRRLRRDAAIVA